MLAIHQQIKNLAAILLPALLGACSAAPPLQAAGPAETATHMLALINQRLAVAPLVAQSKWNSGAAIDDPLREKQILGDIALKAEQEGLDTALARDFFQSQFDAGKLVQAQLHARWRQQQLPPFRQAPDLARDVRPVLDRLTPELIATLKTLQTHLCDADVQDLLAGRGDSPFNKEWDQATRERALAPLRCH
ncbi:MAG: gamma subclass chorismate mutase AroQ [Pseudomonadota bacterium]